MRIRTLTAAALLAVAMTAAPANAARPCVSRADWRAVHTADTIGHVTKAFGFHGRTIVHDVEGLYVIDDTTGEVVPDPAGGTVTEIIRTYRKCRSFDGGRGVVAYDFDDFTYSTSDDDHTQRLVQRARFTAYDLDYYGGSYDFRVAR